MCIRDRYRTLLAEGDTVCIEEASAPQPAAPAKPSTKKPTASKPAAAKPAAPKPAAPAAPAAKPGVKCKFYGVAAVSYTHLDVYKRQSWTN